MIYTFLFHLHIYAQKTSEKIAKVIMWLPLESEIIFFTAFSNLPQ